MDANLLNISKIETYLNSIIDNVVSKNTFFGDIPEKATLDPSWDDMVFIEFPNGINDKNAYGEGVALVWLYVKPLASGRKNVKRMSEMEHTLNEVIAASSHPNYILTRLSTYTDFDTSIDWHCNAVEILVKIY